MTLIKELTTYLAAATGMTIGQDLWATFIQAYAPDRAAVVMAMGGTPSMPTLVGNAGEIPFQVVSRDADPNDAHELAEEIDAVLRDMPGADLTEWFIHTCRGVTVPQELGYDAKQRFEWSAQYVVRAHRKAEAAWLTPTH